MRARCPQVLTLQLPADAEIIPHWLRRVWAFDRGARSPEDQQRTALYRQNVQREGAGRGTNAASVRDQPWAGGADPAAD